MARIETQAALASHAAPPTGLGDAADPDDSGLAATLANLVQELRDAGTTIFINSHLLMEVEMICDSVVIMDKGRILREGTIDELTPRTGRVLFDLVGAHDNLESLLDGLGTNLSVDRTSLELSVEGPEQDQVIDRLRSAGIAGGVSR